MSTVKCWWFGFWIRIAYWLNLRKLVCYFWRSWFKENQRRPLPMFTTPEELQQYMMSRFQYRYDRLEASFMGRRFLFPIDWVSDPEVFQARIEDPAIKDGDCDDIHMWAAAILSRMPGIEKVYLLSSGFQGGGHATVVFFAAGHWRHLDYNLYELLNPNAAMDGVVQRYTKGDRPKEVTFWVFERVRNWPETWKPEAICPARLR
jgi:hypothetical protein